MRLPAPLLVALAKARVARVFRHGHNGRLLEFVDPTDVLHSGSSHPVSHEKIRHLLLSSATGLWIGGSEPLEHPGIAHLVRALAQSKHLIFLETNGMLLRRRIHEFQPLPQLFLVVHLDARKKLEFELALEGLRAARLSGFFTVVRSVVSETADSDGLNRLRNLLLEMGPDGWVITAGSVNPEACARSAEARKLIPSAGWRQFSLQVERELLEQVKDRELRGVPRAENREGETCEEGVKVA
ncbi:MAG TPA: radical SAM protein [Candidatus Acidoferrum sp.]|nr:radical SAM protein [Candidatus Acidoferrum sp.]